LFGPATEEEILAGLLAAREALRLHGWTQGPAALDEDGSELIRAELERLLRGEKP
jgi:hypothetical protein